MFLGHLKIMLISKWRLMYIFKIIQSKSTLREILGRGGESILFFFFFFSKNCLLEVREEIKIELHHDVSVIIISFLFSKRKKRILRRE